MSTSYTPLIVENAIEQHLAGSRLGSLVSIRDAVAMVRIFAPDTQLSDRDLADRIARYAIARHCNVSFDVEFENEQRLETSSRTAA